MARSGILAGLWAVLCLALPAQAGSGSENRQITGSELQDLFSEATAISEYRAFVGIQDYKFSERHNKDGTTRYKEIGVPPVQGRWNLVGGDKICYQYPGVEQLNGTHCFFVYDRGHGCFYNYSRANMLPAGPRHWEAWTSRFVIEGQGGFCGEGIA